MRHSAQYQIAAKEPISAPRRLAPRRALAGLLILLGATVIWSFAGYNKVALAQPPEGAAHCRDLTPELAGMTTGDLLGKYKNVPAWIERGAAGGPIWVFSLDNGARHVAVRFSGDKVIRATEIK